MSAGQFIRRWFLALFAAAMVGGAINVGIDPYGLWDSPRISNINALKPKAATRSRAVKPVMLGKIQPLTVIIGNSRPEMGLDPQDICWTSEHKPVFNLTQPGSSVAGQLALATHSIVASPVKYLFIGVDFSDYTTARTEDLSRPAPYPELFSGAGRLMMRNFTDPNNERIFNLVKDHLDATFSLQALQDSFATIAAQSRQFTTDLTRDGFNSAATFLSVVRHEGQSVLFTQKLGTLKRTFQPKKYLTVPADNPGYYPLPLLNKFLESAPRSIKVVLFINPLHADFLDVLYDSGHWPEFEQWKTSLVSIADKYGVDLWDFTDYDPFSTSTEVAPEDLGSLRWYWEPSHYKARLGHKMISQFIPSCADDISGDKVGMKLSVDNLSSHLQSIRMNRMKYHESLVQEKN
jgi:hypothetical protein